MGAMTSPHELWDATCERVRRQLPTDMYTTYIARLSASSLSRNELLLVTDDEITAEVVKKNYMGLLEKTVADVRGQSTQVRIGSAGPGAEQEPEASVAQLTLFGEQEAPAAGRPRRPQATRPSTPSGDHGERARAANLTPRLSLDRYVRGASNQLAVGAAELLLRSGGAFPYNPLVLVGEVGVGKTHLMNAIGLELLKSHPTLRVRLVTAESFTNGLQEAIVTNRRSEFRARWRDDVDVLLVDDVQFLAGKKATLEEFYHTFNALSHNRLIVLTCDQSPYTLEGFDERLKSRLVQGMIADIKAPDAEMRRAFLANLALRHGVSLDDDVLRHLTGAVEGTFRALAGVMQNVIVRSGERRGRIDRALVDAVIDRLHVPVRENALDEWTLLQAVAEVFGVRREEILSRVRTSRISLPRQVAMHLLREHTELSYPQLGQLFQRDHSTVISNCTTVRKRIDAGDENVLARIAQVERRLGLR